MTTSCFKYKRSTIVYYKRESIFSEYIIHLIKFKTIIGTDMLEMISLHEQTAKNFSHTTELILHNYKILPRGRLVTYPKTLKKISKNTYIKLLLGNEHFKEIKLT